MEVFDEAIANGLQRNPNLSILDAKVIFPQVLDGSSASSIPARGWLQNMGANLSADPSLDAKLRGPRDEEWWYTGLTPSQYFTSATSAEAEDWVYKPLPHPDLSNVTRQQAIDYFQRSWFLTDLLFSGLQGLEAFYRPPYHNQRHPLIFYYVHPAVLYINKFRLAGLVKAPINQEVEILFESGVDSMTWDDLSKNDNLWPLFSVCIEYRRQAYQHIMSILSSHPELGEGDEPVAVTPASSMWALFLGIAHEAIHNETSSVLFRELPLALLQAPPYWPHLPSAYRVITPSDASTFGELKRPEPGSSFPLNDFVEVKSQRLTLGRAHSTVRTFGWDNEFGQAHVTVPSFSVTKFPITNGEFYSFVSSGEYVNDSWWSRDGAAWRSSRNIKAPTFWVALGPQGLQHYGLRTIFHIVELPWSAPVCVNFYEAEAFTAWRAAQSSTPLRLTTEPEMTVLRKSSYPAFSPSSSSSSSSSSPPPLPLDPAIAEDESLQDPLLTPETSLANNLNLSFGAETPVDLYPPTKLGTYDVCGNVWHWCKDFFLPLPGFKVHPYYSDFSTPCFDRAHHSIFGGSFISTGNLANIFARYHFRPFFFQHSGFRIAVSTEGNVEQIPTLEVLIQTEQEKTRLAKASRISTKLSAQISRHFNVPDDNSRLAPGGHAGHGYPQRLFSVVEAALAEHSVPRKRALDLASGVGGVSFELARHFEAVVGLDISKEWVDIAESLKAGKAVSFPVVEEAPVYKELSYSLPPELLSASERCTFHACDGSHPHASLGTFNLVIFSDILSRIPAPRQSLISCKDRVATGGILALITSSQYCNNFYGLPDLINSPTAPESPLPTVEVVTGILSPYFDLLKLSDLPLINRISQREYNLKLYSVTLWKRK